MKQREGHRVIFGKKAEDLIAAGCCPTCGKHKSEWKRTTAFRCCSPDCTHKFWTEVVEVRSWQHLRLQCFKRDNYTCMMCKKIPTPYRTVFRKTRKGYQPPHFGWKQIKVKVKTTDPRYHSELASCLVADHIHAIALGGDEWDLNNLQTLCGACNKIKTASDAAKIAQGRKVEKILDNGKQLQLGGIE